MNTIVVKDVWKKYKTYQDKSSTLKEKILFSKRTSFNERWVLQGIDLEIEKGKTIGLIGENGSGKSTLLKLLTKIIYPNKGNITINGKVSSLLELGAGFHPDMTGRENIYTNASIFGLTRTEINNKLDDIIAFSELEKFIDNQVRTYSSGMYMRLAFSVAINVDAEVLLIDEILAVGDASFQKKCFDRINQMKRNGTTIAIVSHDLGSIEKISDTIVWLKDGKIERIGTDKEIINQYLQYMNRHRVEMMEKEHNAEKNKADKLNAEQQTNTQSKKDKMIDVVSINSQELEKEKIIIKTYNDNNRKTGDILRWGSKEIEIKSVTMNAVGKDDKYCFATGDQIVIEIAYKRNIETSNQVFGIGIFNQDDIQLYGTNTFIDGVKVNDIKKEGVVQFSINKLTLLEGRFYLNVAIHEENGRAYDYYCKCYEFEIVSALNDVGIIRIDHKWIVS